MKIEIKGLEPDKLNPKNFGGMCSRIAVVTRAEGKKIADGIDTVATTDDPAIVIDWERWEMVREILPMKYCELPKNDKVVLLDAHSRYSVTNILGSARNWNITEHELLCKTYIDKNKTDVISLIEGEHLDSVSIGYQTDPNNTVEIPKKAEVLIDGVSYKNEFDDDMPLLVRTAWKVKELSLVPIGADEAAKFRSEATGKIISNDPELQKKINEILNNQKSLTDKINSITITKEVLMDDPTKKENPTPLTREEQVVKDTPEIKKFGVERFNGRFKGLSEVALRGGMTFDQFTVMYTSELERTGGGFETPNTFLGLNGKEIKDFSPTRAAQNILLGKRSGFEFEISQDLEKRTGHPVSEKSILLPADFQNVGLRELYNVNKRAHSTAATEGGDLITPSFYGNLLKEVIRNQTVLGQLGITIISGLKGNFQLPKIVSGLAVYSVAENIAGSTSYVVTDIEEIGPKRLTGNTEYGKQLFLQLDPTVGGFDQILMKDLYQSMNVKTDYEGINGTGLNNRPTGLLAQSNIAAPTLSTVDLKHIINFKRKVAKQNGLKDMMKFLNSVDVETLLETTRRFPDGNGDRTLFQDGKIEGYGSLSSNQVPDAVNIFGNWPEFYMLNWGVEEMIVAEQPKHKEWMVEISLHRLVNFFLRSPESFAIADDAPVSSWDDLDA